jgi:predicted RNA-binding Zn-ribbon protein involved in translation (DUF1610 family)
MNEQGWETEMRKAPRIVVLCPDCGEQRVAPDDVTVRNCLDDGAWSYRFTCPECGGITVGESVERSLLDAVGAGAHFEEWTLPAELLERPDGPPFCLADVLEMHLALLEPDWLDELRCDFDDAPR